MIRIWKYFTRIPLTIKMVFITLIVGVAIWAVLDSFVNVTITNIFNAQLSERLNKQAISHNYRFGRYVYGYNDLAKIITGQKSIVDYIVRKNWQDEKSPEINYTYKVAPKWLPGMSTMRSFVIPRYAVLLDRYGNTREVYHSWKDLPPEVVVRPSIIMTRRTEGVSYLTSVDGDPFLITSEHVIGPNDDVIGTLVLASPIDAAFLEASQGQYTENLLVALISGKDKKIIVSNDNARLPAGEYMKDFYSDHISVSQNFFEFGDSEMSFKFTSIVPRSEVNALTANLVSRVREYRAVTAVVFILSFALIMFLVTRRIFRLNKNIAELSSKTLGPQHATIPKGDEIHALGESFRSFSDKIISSRNELISEKEHLEEAKEELETMNQEISQNQGKLQHALNEISSLIQKAADKKGFDVRYANPGLAKCYELMRCSYTDCECYGKEAMRCWQLSTYCKINHTALHGRNGSCTECPVYMQATNDPIYAIGEHFNNMMHILEGQNRELETAYADLKTTQSQMLQREKMASVGQLAAGVAHEINNPMGFISSNVRTLETYVKKMKEFIHLQAEAVQLSAPEEVANELSEKKKKMKLEYIMNDLGELFEETLDGANRVTVIVQTLKSFSRVDEADVKMSDINECIETTLNIIWNELKYKASVQKDYGAIPLTLCYPQQLNQVFMNLLINASHAIETHGDIIIKTWDGNGMINISISDTGSGIAEDKIEKIFEPFFTTKEVGKGTGLGLSISYDIIKKHNGEISVHSEKGKGTTFTIVIPVVQGK